MSTLTEDGRLNDGFIRTYSGLKFCPSNPQPGTMTIRCIAHSLSLLCRYTGHCRTMYSVAQHSVLCSWVCPPEHALWALGHDISECAVNDLNSVSKHSVGMEGYRSLEHCVQGLLLPDVFNIHTQEPAAVKAADMLLLVTEQRDLMPHSDSSFPGICPLKKRIKPWSCRKAERVFLLRFAELTGAELHWYQRWYLRWIRRGWTQVIKLY